MSMPSAAHTHVLQICAAVPVVELIAHALEVDHLRCLHHAIHAGFHSLYKAAGPVRRWLDGPGSAHFRALGNAPRMSLTCPLRVPVSLTCPLRVPVSLTCPLRVPYESKFVCPSYVPPLSLRMSLVMSHHVLRVPNPSGHTKRPPLSGGDRRDHACVSRDRTSIYSSSALEPPSSASDLGWKSSSARSGGLRPLDGQGAARA